MSEAEDRLYGLMEIAERQQAAAQAALDGLAKERGALQRERELLARQVMALDAGTRAAVRETVQEGFAGAGNEGVEAVRLATRPLLSRLEGVAQSAAQAERALREVVLWASWRLLAWVVGLVAALLLLGWLANVALLAWDTSAIGTAELRKAQLQAEIASLQANRDGWVKSGMLAKVVRCGPRARPCVRVDEAAGAFESEGHADYRVILEY
jgi:hypothetical protein